MALDAEVEDLGDDVLDEGDPAVQQAALVQPAHIARVHGHHVVQVRRVLQVALELQARAVQDLEERLIV